MRCISAVFGQVENLEKRNAPKSKWLLPSVASSARASPIAAECLKPWPEQGDAMMIRSDRGWKSMTNCASGVAVYRHDTALMHRELRPGIYGATYFAYIAATSSSDTSRLTMSG